MTLKLAGILAAVLALLGAGYWTGTLPGKAQIATLKLADQTEMTAALKLKDDALADANAKLDMLHKANEDLSNDFQKKLDASSTLATDLAKRLSDAQGRANSNSLSKAGDKSNIPKGTATPSMGSIDANLGAALAECKTVRDQLNGLLAELEPQL